MTSYLPLAAIVVGALCVLCLVHAIVSRVVRYSGYGLVAPQKVALGTIMAGNVPLAYVAWAVVLKGLRDNPLELLCGIAYVLLTYNGYCYCYFNVLNASETSLHVNILMRLLTVGSMRSEELSQRYGAKDMISARIERMIALGQLQRREDRYILSSRALVIVGRLINIWRRILGVPLSPQ